MSVGKDTDADNASTQVGGASRFWARLSDGHRQLLERYGAREVKRRQALEYFNWRYIPGDLRGNFQVAFLRKHTSIRQKLTAMMRVRITDPGWAGLDWSRKERAAYCYFTQLTWEYAKRHGDQAVIALTEPDLGSPLPIFDKGRRVSQDLANSALEVGAIRGALGATQPSRIVEIGAGYGRTAFALLSVFPTASYVIVDIEPARSISEWYLGELLPDRKITCLTPDQFVVSRDSFDLGLSISSLHEMTFAQLDEYLKLLDERVDGVVYLKQWTEWANPDDKITSRFTEYPIPPSWRAMFRRPCPVQAAFTEAAWSTRSTG